MPAQPDKKYMPPWIFGVLYGGTFNGFAAVSLSQLLPDHGVSLERVSEIVALILTASYVSFLVTPLVDCGLPRKVWAGILACTAAVCLGISVPMLKGAGVHGGHGRDATALMLVLFVGYLCNQIYTSAIGGMVPNLVAPAKHGAVSAWMNIAYLALTGGGGALSVWEVRHLPLPAATVLVPLPVLLGAIPLLFFPREERKPNPVSEAMGQLFANLAATAKKPNYLFALMVFVVPSATFALQNLFGGMGADFHAGPELTNLSVGLLFTIACSIGAALGGPLSSRMDRRLLFIAPAMIAALGNLVMAFGPHTPWMFAGGLFFYNLMAGINYTATSALVFQIVGRNNPLSATQYSVCIAACNLAIAASVFMDGKGAGRGGANGALIVDAGLSLVLGAIVLALVWKYGGGFPKPPASEEDLALEAEAGVKAA
jgi:PAT family beta-lactamase induction signal transducer AmpG